MREVAGKFWSTAGGARCRYKPKRRYQQKLNVVCLPSTSRRSGKTAAFQALRGTQGKPAPTCQKGLPPPGKACRLPAGSARRLWFGCGRVGAWCDAFEVHKNVKPADKPDFVRQVLFAKHLCDRH